MQQEQLKWTAEAKVLHIEPTNVCQAECPLCTRQVDPSFNKHLRYHLSMQKILNAVGEQTIKNLNKMYLNGMYGDPAAGRHTLNIFKSFKQINPSITLGMNTNGAIHRPNWWKNLAKILNGRMDYVIFSIDGLEDTNHIYRKNVIWDNLMQNANAFIKSGGRAHWDMLVFEHNQHQVDDCEKLAKQLGFRYFRTKVSTRDNNVTWLKPPKQYSSEIVKSEKIDCYRNKEQSLYMDSQGQLYPCGWLANSQFDIFKFDQVISSWHSKDCNATCQRICGTKNNMTSYSNQFKKEVKLTKF